jgi:hypothetical protein
MLVIVFEELDFLALSPLHHPSRYFLRMHLLLPF